MTEEQLLSEVLENARELGIMTYHAYFSIRSAPGFPDLVLAGPGGIIFAELKTESGDLSPAQLRWKWRLAAAGGRFEIWRPRHWLSGQITRELKGIA